MVLAPPAVTAPVITSQPASQTVFAGQPVTFSVGVQDATGVSYQWLRNLTDIAGATGPSYTLAAAAVGDSGSTYSVRAGSAGGTVLSSAASLTVTPKAVEVPLGVSLLDGQLRSFEFFPDIPTRPPAFGALVADAEGAVYSLATSTKYLPSGQTATVPDTVRASFTDSGGYGPTRYVTLAPDGNFIASIAYFFPGTSLNTSVPFGGSISRVTPAGAATVLASWRVPDHTPSPVGTAPGSVAADRAGNVYFLDYFEGGPFGGVPGGALRKLAPDGTVSTLLPGTGYSLYILDFSQAALALSPSGELHIVYRNRIAKLDAHGNLTLLAGTDGVGDVVDGTGSRAQFYRAGYPAFDAAGNLYVADGNTVRKVTPAGVVTMIAGSGSVRFPCAEQRTAVFLAPPANPVSRFARTHEKRPYPPSSTKTEGEDAQVSMPGAREGAVT